MIWISAHKHRKNYDEAYFGREHTRGTTRCPRYDANQLLFARHRRLSTSTLIEPLSEYENDFRIYTD